MGLNYRLVLQALPQLFVKTSIQKLGQLQEVSCEATEDLFRHMSGLLLALKFTQNGRVYATKPLPFDVIVLMHVLYT